MGEHRSLKPGPGTFIVADANGARVRPWQESSTRGPIGQSEWHNDPAVDAQITAKIEQLKATAPPIRKTSGLEKQARLMGMLGGHIDSWRAMIGRPLTVGDLSAEMQQLMKVRSLPATTEITAEMLAHTAASYLSESERQMRAAQKKKVTKEAFYVPAGVR